MVSVGYDGVNGIPRGCSEIAAAQNRSRRPSPLSPPTPSSPKALPRTAREENPRNGLNIIYDKGYPPSTTDFAR